MQASFHVFVWWGLRIFSAAVCIPGWFLTLPCCAFAFGHLQSILFHRYFKGCVHVFLLFTLLTPSLNHPLKQQLLKNFRLFFYIWVFHCYSSIVLGTLSLQWTHFTEECYSHFFILTIRCNRSYCKTPSFLILNCKNFHLFSLLALQLGTASNGLHQVGSLTPVQPSHPDCSVYWGKGWDAS